MKLLESSNNVFSVTNRDNVYITDIVCLYTGIGVSLYEFERLDEGFED